ncbi:MAG: right-handed parallel beta-helix repeat-containing protein [Bacteroidetes bacterium]|nr:right-handed parallel beta-helix repeat-containing protein [Bacteroidota bacterium]
MFPVNYYFSSTGNDGNSGTSASQPWLSFSILQTVIVHPGDSILFMAGDSLTSADNISLWKWVDKGPDGIYGTADDVLYGNATQYTPGQKIVLTTYPVTGAKAVITFTNDVNGIDLYNVQGIEISNLRLKGIGYASGPVHHGISVYCDDAWGAPLTDTLKHYKVNNSDGTGFNAGIFIGGWHRKIADVVINNCNLYGNKSSGIDSRAPLAGDIYDVKIRYCNAYNNPGDPASPTHSGNGIVLGEVNKGLIEHCMAYHNGWQNTAVGGPVGIWTYDATDVTIQYCEAWNNKTNSAADGGGFDLDGGAQNCTIQYCYSHDNDGPGFLICQYSGARAFNNNTVRYCISKNDGRKNGAGGIHFWSAGSNGGITGTEIYNNTVYNEISSVVNFQNTSGISGVKVRNNIFISANDHDLVSGNPATSVAKFEDNSYWSSGGVFDVAGYSSLSDWRTAMSQEISGGLPSGFDVDPMVMNPAIGDTVKNSDHLDTLTVYMLLPQSPLINMGLDLRLPANGSLNVGLTDFFGNPIPLENFFEPGANEFQFLTASWTGTASTDWNTSTNWSNLRVPDFRTNVTIPNVTNQPEINTTGNNCYNLTSRVVQPSKSMQEKC